jgi:hypothetical protein
MPTTSTARITAEPIRTGRSALAATAGRAARTAIPSTTGTRTIANTSTTSTNGSRTSSCRPYQAIARPVTSGSVKSAMTELIAVSVMFSATSPRNRWLNRLALVPPGEAASSIIPMPSSGGRSKSTTRPKHTAGSSRSWQARAVTTARGARPIRRKSPGVRSRPRPNMMIARATGRPIVVSAESTRRP